MFCLSDRKRDPAVRQAFQVSDHEAVKKGSISTINTLSAVVALGCLSEAKIADTTVTAVRSGKPEARYASVTASPRDV